MLVLLTDVLKVGHAVVLVVVLARLEAFVLVLFLLTLPVDVLDMPMLLAEVRSLKCCFLSASCWRSWRWSEM